MTRRTVLRRTAKTVWFASLAGAAVVLVVLLGSTRLRASLTGSPFWCKTEVSAGAVEVEWFPLAANGSRSGFGNPGWRMGDSGSFGLTLVPRMVLRGPVHGVRVPLWLPVGVLVLLAWAGRRLARRMRDLSKCAACGYSTEGLPARAPCPECGRVLGFVRRLLRGLGGMMGAGRAVQSGRAALAQW